MKTKLAKWDFNIFRFQEYSVAASYGTLTHLGFEIFKQEGFIEDFSLDPIQVRQTFSMIIIMFQISENK